MSKAFLSLFLTLLSLSSNLYGQDDMYRHGDRNSKKIALTIDDGWTPDWELIQYLEEEEVPWAAFVPGVIARSRPEWVAELASRGVPVGNHGYSHHWLTPKSDGEVREELQKTKDLLIELTGDFYPYFRPSAGQFDQRILDIAAELGYQMVLWDNYIGYPANVSREEQLQFLLDHLQGGSIILGHFGSPDYNMELIRPLVAEARKRGYTFVPLEELLPPGNR